MHGFLFSFYVSIVDPLLKKFCGSHIPDVSCSYLSLLMLLEHLQQILLSLAYYAEPQSVDVEHKSKKPTVCRSYLSLGLADTILVVCRHYCLCFCCLVVNFFKILISSCRQTRVRETKKLNYSLLLFVSVSAARYPHQTLKILNFSRLYYQLFAALICLCMLLQLPPCVNPSDSKLTRVRFFSSAIYEHYLSLHFCAMNFPIHSFDSHLLKLHVHIEQIIECEAHVYDKLTVRS